jgi:hypothetical protein
LEEEEKELTKRKRGIGLSSAAASLAEEALASSGEETGLHGQQQQHVVRDEAAREAVASPDSLLPPRGRERWQGEETKKKSGLIFFSRRKKKKTLLRFPIRLLVVPLFGDETSLSKSHRDTSVVSQAASR